MLEEVREGHWSKEEGSVCEVVEIAMAKGAERYYVCEGGQCIDMQQARGAQFGDLLTKSDTRQNRHGQSKHTFESGCGITWHMSTVEAPQCQQRSSPFNHFALWRVPALNFLRELARSESDGDRGGKFAFEV